MRVVSLLVAMTLTASPVAAQPPQPIHASIERAAAVAAERGSFTVDGRPFCRKKALF